MLLIFSIYQGCYKININPRRRHIRLHWFIGLIIRVECAIGSNNMLVYTLFFLSTNIWFVHEFAYSKTLLVSVVLSLSMICSLDHMTAMGVQIFQYKA